MFGFKTNSSGETRRQQTMRQANAQPRLELQTAIAADKDKRKMPGQDI